MKILILVLSARRPPWGALMDTSRETWDSEEHPQTRTLFYCGESAGDSSKCPSPKVFYSPNFSEDLDDVSARTIEAFEKSLELDWDFLARPNSSCYVHKKNLVAFVETLPTENMLCGLLTTGNNTFLWGGGQYIISRDVVENFVANKDKWDLNVMDDNSITDLARALAIPLSGNGRMASINEQNDGSFLLMAYGIGENFSFTDWTDIKKAHPHHFFRVKQDLMRDKDLAIMRELQKYLP